MAKKMKKVLCCLVVLMILTSAMPVSVFAVQESSSSETVSAQRDQGDCPSVVKFKGTATTDEKCCFCYGSYYCKVKVEELLSNPGNRLKSGNEYTICYGDSPKNIKTRDKLEVYGEYFHSCGALQLMGNIIAFNNNYYIKKISSESLSISVWTDKSEYKIGETVKIYYQTNKKCTAKLTVTKPNGENVVYGPNEIPACTRSKSATAGYPTGKRTVVFEAWAGARYKKATCYFEVVEEKKPDLIIKDISWSPSSPDKGDTIKFTVKIKNQGSGSAGSSTVKYYIDGSYVSSDSVSKLSAGSTSTETFTWTASKCGNVKVKAVADANNDVYESGGKNNDRTETVSIKCPTLKSDLIITDISWSPSNPDDGDIIAFTVTIENQGSGSAGSSTVKYYVDGSYVDYDSVPALSAGLTSTQTFTWTANKCGNVQVKAVADANNAVDEGTNDGNNDRTETINVICGEETAPEIIKVTYPTACVKEGEDATISVTVKNNGGASSEGYISVSFPNDEQIYDVSGTGSTYNKLYLKGSGIWNNKDQQMESVDPLVELLDTSWVKGQQETIRMNVKSNSGSDEIVFYVRAALKNTDGTYERDPTYSGDKDQQGWCVERHVIDVCPKEACVIIDDDTCDGYKVYVDDVYQLTEGVGETLDGSCTFYVAGGTHTIEIRDNECHTSITRNFEGTYTWNSMPDNWCKGNTAVKFRGVIVKESLPISFYNYKIKIDEILMDPSGVLNSGDEIWVWAFSSGPAMVDSVSIADKVEVYGTYDGELHREVKLETAEHYHKNLEKQEIKFNGTAIVYFERIGARGWYVTVDEIISGPPESLLGHTIKVYPASVNPSQYPSGYVDPNIKPEDKVEVYGWYQGYHIVSLLGSADYYIKLSDLNPKLCTSPDILSHNFGTVPKGQERSWQFDITNCGSKELEWLASCDQPWIKGYPPSGLTTTGTDRVTITIDTSELDSGTTHEGHITVTSNGGEKKGTITVAIPPEQEGPILCTSPDPPSHDFGIVPKGQERSWNFDITNCESDTLYWSIVSLDPWIRSLNVIPSSTKAGETDTARITIYTDELKFGQQYEGHFRILSNGGEKEGTISVEVNIPPPEPKLCTSPDPPSHDFGTVPKDQKRLWTLDITNCGSGGTLEWSLSCDPNWIEVKPTSGSTTTTDKVTVTIDTSSLSEGKTYTGQITVTSNDESKTGTITVEVTQQPNQPPTNPTLTPDKPEPQTAGTAITWTTSATDPDGDSLYYQFTMKGPSTGNVMTGMRGWSTDNTWTWETSSEDIGNTDISVLIRDGYHEPFTSYDLEKTYSDYTIEAGNQPPTNPSLTPDKPEPQIAGTAITWTASATDPDGDSLYYQFRIKGPSTGNSWTIKRDWSTDNTWKWDTSLEGIGNTDISVLIRDGYHEPFTSYDLEQNYGDYNIKADTTDPVVTIDSPANGAKLYNTWTVVVNWHGSDADSDIDHYEVQLDNNAWKNVGTSTSYTFYSLSLGLHKVTVKVYDKADNSNSDVIAFVIGGSDITNPVVTIDKPAEGVELYNARTVEVNWHGSDVESGIDYYEVRLDDGGAWNNVGTSTSYTFYSVSAGLHKVTVKVYDRAGNWWFDVNSFEIKKPPDSDFSIACPLSYARGSEDLDTGCIDGGEVTFFQTDQGFKVYLHVDFEGSFWNDILWEKCKYFYEIKLYKEGLFWDSCKYTTQIEIEPIVLKRYINGVDLALPDLNEELEYLIMDSGHYYVKVRCVCRNVWGSEGSKTDWSKHNPVYISE